MQSFKNKVIIVTGGARGIGKIIAKKFVDLGGQVVICSRNQEEITATCNELNKRTEQVKGIVGDVSSLEDCKKLISFAQKEFGRIDILVNNAGVYGPIGLLENNDLAEWAKAIEINLLGTVNCSQAIIPVFKKQKKGKIINMAGAGIGGRRPLSRFSSYYVSKGAVVFFTEVLASELIDSHIQVNCVAPGAVNTFLTDSLLQKGKEDAGEYMYQQALKQKETGGDSPELAAECIAFLASPEADHITGKMISAKWDAQDMLRKTKHLPSNLFTLRRIDDALFYEK